MPDSQQKADQRAKNIRTCGIAGTLGYLVVMTIYAIVERAAMLAMKPEEFATFLAGVFSPLAFAWVVLGYFQQGDELRHSARALYLQGEELRNSVEQQREMVDVSRAQLKAEIKAREEDVARARQAALPRLQLESTGMSGAPRGADYHYELTNLGPACTNVVATRSGHLGQRAKILDHGRAIVITLEARDNEETHPIEIVVTYTASDGHPGAEAFVIQPYTPPLLSYPTGYGPAVRTR